MAFGDRFKDWFGWGDDDDSAFSDDVWDTLGVDKSPDDDSWWDSVGTTITPIEESNWIDDWSNFDFDEEYGIGSLINEDPNIFDDDWATTYDFGGWGDDTPTVDFEDPDFNWGEFDVDSYLDDLLDPNWGGGTEGDPSSWFIDSGDPAYQDYSGVGGGMPGPPSIADFDTSILDEIEKAGGLDAFLPVTDVDFWENVRDESGNIDPSLFTGPRSRGPLGGGIGPWLRNFFLGSGGTGGTGENKQGSGIMGLLNSLLGGGDGGGLLGGGGLGTLGALWALNKARKEGSDPGAVIPMGQQTYGMDDVYGGPTQDYRVFNIQPALMPGVAYANVGKPEGMKGGGIASLDGPGDVTPAWLEPGEFVMTKKATGNIGAQNLYKMMKEAEGMS